MPSRCDGMGDNAHEEDGIVAAWDCVPYKIFRTSTPAFHFWKPHCDSSWSLKMLAEHSSPSKHHMYRPQQTHHK